ncbi:uncharacterized protein P174DRAFT_430705 [Aspergillus novofumigatus IBT 16806]|uniref:Uncharacterized protein n=1 Tax=Aspergillus novofumigatus (strain IBT 16806) TaxID=1392255 RepID=A0A2I1C7X8_ASPN1|nr:uncharacterized protein P174DRAFT_430705 [Aspergillus novofumigatus IBT 16806]PKX93715.1 hypothetical protein P174DRAFT_430705 [Aspergillus novofumigatus IBT 16806]
MHHPRTALDCARRIQNAMPQSGIQANAGIPGEKHQPDTGAPSAPSPVPNCQEQVDPAAAGADDLCEQRKSSSGCVRKMRRTAHGVRFRIWTELKDLQRASEVAQNNVL